MPPRIHPDTVARMAFCNARAGRMASGLQVATERWAPFCRTQGCRGREPIRKSIEGHGTSKRRRNWEDQERLICPVCRSDWESWIQPVIFEGSRVRGNPGAKTFRSRVTSGPRRAKLHGHEERLLGTGNLASIGYERRAYDLANRMMQRGSHVWAARVYFAYELRYSAVRSRGGMRVLAGEAAERFTRAPFAWTKTRVHELVHEGRTLWAGRLQRAGLIERGDWWRKETETD